ncbi:MAG: formylglycine-generating enzyme family protein [Planctomycetota bacterium]
MEIVSLPGTSIRTSLVRHRWGLLIALGAMVAFGWDSSTQATGQDAATNQPVSDTATLGIAAKKPETGPFVPLPDGTFMVPYTQRVDSTEIAFEMIPIPGGELVIGSPDDEANRSEDEGPQFTVNVPPFWMGKTEVTWAEYKTFMKCYDIYKRLSRQGVRKVTDMNQSDALTVPTPLYEPSHTYEHGDNPRQPAVTMTQYAAKQYTKWLSGITLLQYRLPSEAEWEHAARSNSKTSYSFGDDPSQLGDYAAFADNSPDGAPKVGSKKPNPFGLHDMHGSVWEWTIDQYAAEGYGDRAGKKLTLEDAIAWPSTPDMRCVRGGGWQDPAERLRSAARMGSADEDWKDFDPNVPLSPWWYTTDPARMVGMRVVRSLRQKSLEELDRYWNVDNEAIREDVEFRLREGRGVLGIAVPELTEEFKRKK